MLDEHVPQPAAPTGGGWLTYVFKTRLGCPLGCPPGTHPLYEGKSNAPWRRVLEEARNEPWFPYASGWDIYPEVHATEAEALAAEAAHIRDHLPLANKVLNLDNPHRMDFGPSTAAPRPARAPKVLRRSWSRSQRRAAGVAAVWLVLAGLSWWLVCRFAHAHAVTGAEAGALAASAILLLAWSRTRSRRSMTRPLGTWTAAVSALGAVALVYWPAIWPIVSAFRGTTGR